jgi:hypothetical protein
MTKVCEMIQAVFDAGSLDLEHVSNKAGFIGIATLDYIRQGITILPSKMIVPLALALNIDPALLYCQAMSQYRPKEWAILELTLGGRAVTAQNIKHVETLRVLGAKLDSLSEADYDRYCYAINHLGK